MNLSWCTETLNPLVVDAQETVWHTLRISPNDPCWRERCGHLPKKEGYFLFIYLFFFCGSWPDEFHIRQNSWKIIFWLVSEKADLKLGAWIQVSPSVVTLACLMFLAAGCKCLWVYQLMLITNTMWTHSNQKSVLALQLFNIQYFVASLGEKTPIQLWLLIKKKLILWSIFSAPLAVLSPNLNNICNGDGWLMLIPDIH